MQNPITIRPTTSSDSEAIAGVADSTSLFPGDMLGAMIAGYFDKTLEDIWLTAEQNGRPVGFCFCEPERFTNGSWNLRAIGVQPEHQSTGIGAVLMRHLEDTLRQKGGRILIVETTSAPDQARTCGFYLANGYVEEARLREFWDVGIDKIVFWKHL